MTTREALERDGGCRCEATSTAQWIVQCNDGQSCGRQFVALVHALEVCARAGPSRIGPRLAGERWSTTHPATERQLQMAPPLTGQA